MINKEPLTDCIWEYDLNENQIYDILINNYDKPKPITREQLIHKLFRYMHFYEIENIFTKEEIYDIIKCIKIDFIRNEANKEKVKEFIIQFELNKKERNNQCQIEL